MSTREIQDLRLIQEALTTHIRHLTAYIHKSSHDELRILWFQDLKDRVDAKLLEA